MFQGRPKVRLHERVCVCVKEGVCLFEETSRLKARGHDRSEETAGGEIRKEQVPVSAEEPQRSWWDAPHRSRNQCPASPPHFHSYCAGASSRRYHMAVCITRSAAVVWWWGQQKTGEEAAVGVCLEEIRNTEQHRGVSWWRFQFYSLEVAGVPLGPVFTAAFIWSIIQHKWD